MSRWGGTMKPPAVKRKPCRFKCGQHVDTFTESHGYVVQLDMTPPSVDVDLAATTRAIYEFRGPRIGWVPKFTPERGWREIRLVHECTAASMRTRTRTRKGTT